MLVPTYVLVRSPTLHERSRRDVMASEKLSGRSTCMTDIRPSRTGTLASISMDCAPENLEITRKHLFSEEVYQTTMSSYEAFSAQTSPVTVAFLNKL